MEVKEIKLEILKLSSLKILEILHDCVCLLAPIPPAEMALHECISKKQILNRMASGKYMIFNFDDRKYPIMNDQRKNSM